MANEIIFRESFDYYNGVGLNTGLTAVWYVQNSSYSLVAGRFDGQALYRYASGPNIPECQALLDFAVSEFAFGAACKFLDLTASGTARSLLRVKDGYSNFQVGVAVQPDGAIRAVRQTSYSTSVILGTSDPGLITEGTWCYIEVEGVIHDTAGELRVYLNGDPVPVIDLAGVNTRNAGPTVNTFALGPTTNSPSDVNRAYYDDIYVKQGATRLGPRRITTRRVDGDASVMWTPSAGLTNFENLDETLIDSADFVSSLTLNDVDEYTVSNLTLNPTIIDEVSVVVCAAKDGVDARAIKFGLSSSAQVDESADQYLPGADYSIWRHPVPLDPNGGIPWTATTVNSLRARIKVSV